MRVSAAPRRRRDRRSGKRGGFCDEIGGGRRCLGNRLNKRHFLGLDGPREAWPTLSGAAACTEDPKPG
jgi:hypothetical protein